MKGGDYMLMRRNESDAEMLAEMAEQLFPRIHSIYCGTLYGKEARKVVREGESILRKLKRLNCQGVSIQGKIESLKVSIEMAKGEIEHEPKKISARG